jgi:hypothetical protein
MRVEMKKIHREDVQQEQKLEASLEGAVEMCKLIIYEDCSISINKPTYISDELAFGILEYGMLLFATSTVEDLISEALKIENSKERLSRMAKSAGINLVENSSGNSMIEKIKFAEETLEKLRMVDKNKKIISEEYNLLLKKLNTLLDESTLIHKENSQLH